MAHLSVSETTTFRWSLVEDVVRYAAVGIPAVGVWRHKLSDCGLAKARRVLRRNRLTVSHLAWGGGFTGSDGRSHRESIDDAAEAVATAAALGCRTLLVYSGPRAGHTLGHARRLVEAALRELAPRAAECDVTLAVKPMHPGCAREWTFLTSVGDTLRLLDAVDRPNVKMVLDTYHLGHEKGLARQMADVAPRTAMVQLGDARRPPKGEQNRCRLGDGIVPLAEIVAALKRAGYDGYYDVELLGKEIEPADYEALLEHAKEAFRTLVGSGQ
jgi:sugar phosphate isomerase/epimerase